MRRAKNRFEEGRQVNLDKLVRSPKKWWTEVRKLGLISGKNKSRTDKVYDEEGVVRQGKEAVEEWRRYFERVLNEGGSLKGQGGREMGVDENGLFDEGITREEVEQALGKLKQKAAPGSGGLTAEVISSKELVGFWQYLFNWCWTNRMVSSEWRRSVIVPIPKKRGGGACKMNEF